MQSTKFYQTSLKILIIITIIILILPNFSWGNSSQVIFAQIQLPETLEKVKTRGLNILEFFPQILREVWQEVLRIWKEMIRIGKDVWSSFIGPKIKVLEQKIKDFLGKEIETRKPIIESEFKEEKTELKNEISKSTKSLWEKFKELIKFK